jgi:hypothetical protein
MNRLLNIGARHSTLLKASQNFPNFRETVVFRLLNVLLPVFGRNVLPDLGQRGPGICLPLGAIEPGVSGIMYCG